MHMLHARGKIPVLSAGILSASFFSYLLYGSGKTYLGYFSDAFFLIYHLYDLAALKRHVPYMLCWWNLNRNTCHMVQYKWWKTISKLFTIRDVKKKQLAGECRSTIAVFVMADLSVAFFMEWLFSCLTSMPNGYCYFKFFILMYAIGLCGSLWEFSSK